MHKCSQCNGSGWVTLECDSCNGSGYASWSEYGLPVTCPSCDGTGLKEHCYCPECAATGYIKDEEDTD